MSDPGDASPAALTNDDFRRMLAEAAARPRPVAEQPAKSVKPRKPKPKAGDGGDEDGEDAGPSYR
jgi:hypothetical protein